MIEEKQVTIRKQIAEEGNWLYQDQPQDVRVFSKEVYLGAEGTEWQECTDAEKLAWEEAHKLQDIPDPAEDVTAEETSEATPTE